MMDIEHIATVAHDVQNAFLAATGHRDLMGWHELSEAQHEKAIKAVKWVLDHPDASPSNGHHEWLSRMTADGWVLGGYLDPSRKEHPHLVPFEQLPLEQRAKDFLFQGTVRSLAAL